MMIFMQNFIDLALRRPRKNLFEYPSDHEMPKFEAVIADVNKLTLEHQDGKLRLTAKYIHNGERLELTATCRTLQAGQPDKPRVVYIPWYSGTSGQIRRLLIDKIHTDWTHEGIDLFVPAQNFNRILATAGGSQYGYALGLRMLAERIEDAHNHNQKVAVVGVSYGANLTSAYVTHGGELPDAMVGIEGGDIVRSTTESSLRPQSDPKIIAIIEKDRSGLPSQKPFNERAAKRAATVINQTDEFVKGQEDLWGNASEKLYISGSHFLAPLLHRAKIRRFTNAFLDKMLT